MNIIYGFITIFAGAIIGYVTRLLLPYMITGTDVASALAVTMWPIAVFFIVLLLGFFIMIGRKGKQGQPRQ